MYILTFLKTYTTLSWKKDVSLMLFMKFNDNR